MSTYRNWVESHEKLRASVFWLASGAVIATVALVIDLLADAMAIATAQVVLNRSCAEGFGDSTLIVIVGVAVTSSFVFGFCLLNMGRQVGTKSDIHDYSDWGALKRSRFMIGTFAVFIPVTPLKWLLVLSMAFCHGG